MAFHVAGDGVGPAFRAGAVGQHAGQARGVLAQQGVVDAGAQRSKQAVLGLVALVVGAVIGRHAGAAVAHQTGFLQLGQVGRHARLRQVQHRGQFGHGEFLVFEQGQQAHAGGIGQ